MVGVWLMLALAVLATSETFVNSAVAGGQMEHQSDAELGLNRGMDDNGAKVEVGTGFQGEDFGKYTMELASLDQNSEEKEWFENFSKDIKTSGEYMTFPNGTRSEEENDKVQRPVYGCSGSYFTTYLYSSGDYGIFRSPGYSSHYPSVYRCGWTVRTRSPRRLRLFCPDVTMARYGYLEVWDLDYGVYFRATYSRNGYYNFRGRNVRIGLLNQWYYSNRGFRCYIIAS